MVRAGGGAGQTLWVCTRILAVALGVAWRGCAGIADRMVVMWLAHIGVRWKRLAIVDNGSRPDTHLDVAKITPRDNRRRRIKRLRAPSDPWPARPRGDSSYRADDGMGGLVDNSRGRWRSMGSNGDGSVGLALCTRRPLRERRPEPPHAFRNRPPPHTTCTS